MSDDQAPDQRGSRSWGRLALQAGALAFVGGLLALLVLRTISREAGPHLFSEVKAGTKPLAPGFELSVLWPHTGTWPPPLRRALADGDVSPRELRGYPVVINFWASWCIPCKAEAPRLVASARAHAGEVVFLGVDVQDFKSDARRFLERYQTNYVSVRDGGDSTYSAYGLTGLPETYYLDGGGRVLAHSAGEISETELEAGIERALGR
jgi:cytochrome c biogenesis protein CcmG, thiol:disulfide interchange protein DsbE